MRVLILSASTGGGHKTASAALKNIILEKQPDATVEIVDAIEYCGHIYNKTISDGYQYLATKAPTIYGKMYVSSGEDTWVNAFVTKFNKQLSKKLLPLFLDFKPDIIVCCHAFISEMVSALVVEGSVTVPVISIITDFAAHKTYINKGISAYVVANDDMIDELMNVYGVEREKIHSLGIPINSVFYKKKDRHEILESLRFKDGVPIVLIMAGSFGVTDILKIYENLIQLDDEFQIIVITGRNRKLYDAFDKLVNRNEDSFEIEDDDKYSPESKLRKMKEFTNQLKDDFSLSKIKFKRSTNKTKPTALFFFISNVADYMSVADLIITKPGGLTVSESLASGLPLAIFSAYPGQEKDNAEFLVRHNLAINLDRKNGAQQIHDLLAHPEKLEQMKANCKKHFKDRSAEHIYGLMLDLIAKNKNMEAPVNTDEK